MKCPACQTTYGNSGGHCAGCHHSFTSQTAFDAHRIGPFDARSCVEVESDPEWRQGRSGWWTNAAEFSGWTT